MAEHENERKKGETISEEELRLLLEKELELSVTAEINRIREEKKNVPSGDILPPAPDFRPNISDFSGKKSRKKEKIGKTARGDMSENAPDEADGPDECCDRDTGDLPVEGPPAAAKKSSSALGRAVSYIFVFLFLIAAVIASFWLLYSLYGGRLSSLLHSDGDAVSSEKESGAGEKNSDAPSGGIDASSDRQSGDGDQLPSGGFSVRDAVFTVETINDESRSSNGTVVFTWTIDLPKLEYPSNPAAERKIVASLTALSEDYQKKAREQAAAYAADFVTGASPGSYEVRLSSMCAADGILTLTSTVTSLLGGASPLTTVECWNFDGATGELLALSDVVTDLSQLAALSVSHVDKSLVWEEIYESVITATVCDSWYPSAEGIVLIYQQYSIGPGASGTIEVLIPYAELAGMLSETLTGG